MDNVALEMTSPQEDEFALCLLGIPSPYFKLAFPNRPLYSEYRNLDDLGDTERNRWTRQFVTFLRMLTFKEPKRIVLKGPLHTFRIPTLLELFPKARFVYLARDPYVTIPSTLHLWRCLYFTQGFQVPDCTALEDFVFENYLRMQQRWAETRPLIPKDQLFELRYEKLEENPMAALNELYRHLELGDFELVRPSLEKFIAGTKDYQKNRYHLSVRLAERIRRAASLPIG